EAEGGQLVDDLVGERARARDHADRARLVDVARHDADLALARRDDTRAVRADEHGLGVVALEHVLDAHHVARGDAFGDRDDQLDTGRGRFEDRVRGERRWHVDDGCVRAGEPDRFIARVVHRDVLEPGDLAAALARRDTGDDARAVLDHLLRVKRAGRAGHALHDEARVVTAENAHEAPPVLGVIELDLRSAPPAMSAAAMMLRPDSFSIFLPSSTFVPSRRTTSGTLRPTSLTAAMTPAA